MERKLSVGGISSPYGQTKQKEFLARGQSGFGVRKGEGHPAGTIELRLEGRWLRLWGLLGREVSLDEEELCLLSPTAVGPQPSDHWLRSSGRLHLSALCRWRCR